MGVFVNFKLVLSFSLAFILVGCGKSKKSSGNVGIVSNQGSCSQATIDLHKELTRISKQDITSHTKFNQINQSCLKLQQEMGGNSCPVSNQNSRIINFISYSQLANYCAEIESNIAHGNRTPPPRPVPVNPRPTPNPPRYSNILVEDLGIGYALRFKKSHLNREDLDLRHSQTRCRISMPDHANDNLRRVRGKLTWIRVQIYQGGATYDIGTSLTETRDLVRLNCSSHNQKLTLQELNQVLSEVAEVTRNR